MAIKKKSKRKTTKKKQVSGGIHHSTTSRLRRALSMFDEPVETVSHLQRVLGDELENFSLVSVHTGVIEPSQTGGPSSRITLVEALQAAGINVLLDDVEVAIPLKLWRAIVVYMKQDDGFAGLTLAEFLKSTMGKHNE